MATLTNPQLADLRQRFVAAWGDAAIDFDKPTINAAFQAIEDWYQANKADVAAAVNTATLPYSFTAAEKKWLVAMYFYFRFVEDG